MGPEAEAHQVHVVQASARGVHQVVEQDGEVSAHDLGVVDGVHVPRTSCVPRPVHHEYVVVASCEVSCVQSTLFILA